MKKEIVFRREEAFKEWLPNNGVVTAGVGYASKIKTIQRHLQSDIDQLLKNGIEHALERINGDNIHLGKGTIRDLRSILRKYYKFIQSKD